MNFIMDRWEIEARRIIFSYAFEQGSRLINSGGKLVHYTTSRAMRSIIDNETVWIRNARLMNDFSEIEHGTVCLRGALNDTIGNKLRGILSRPGLSDLIDQIEAGLPSLVANTYLFSLSEHPRQEDHLGRLSMWRGYGEDGSVAVVLSSSFLTSGVAAPSPVGYFDPPAFLHRFSQVVNALSGFVARSDPSRLRPLIELALRAAVTSSKHPGFAEEKEWRLIFDEVELMRDGFESEIVTLKNFPERIYKIPLKGSASLATIIDRVIIGPSRNADDVRRDLVERLIRMGLADAERRVVCSNIPFRREITSPAS